MLGIRIDYQQEKGTLAISQKQVIRDLVKDFKIIAENTETKCRYKNVKYPSTPIDPQLHVDDLPAPSTEEEKEENLKRHPNILREYRSIIGSLMYLMVGTRPDIGYAVSALSKHLSNPGFAHMNAAKRVVRYLLGTIDKCIVYKSSESEFKLIAFTDSDWAGCKKSRRSQSGGVIFAAGGPILWHSTRQPIVTLSSAEAELTALTVIVKELMWLRKICWDLNVRQTSPTLVLCDNIAAMQIAEESSIKRKTKHTDTYYMFVRDEIEDGNIELEYVSTLDNVADILTKGCLPGVFTRLREILLKDLSAVLND
jgi:hypothetical protein